MLHDIASSATVNLSLKTNATSLSNNVSVAKQYKFSFTCVCMTSLYNMQRRCSSPLSPPPGYAPVMGSPRARLWLGIGVVMDCYIRLPVCSALNTRVMRNTRVVRLLYMIQLVDHYMQFDDDKLAI